MEFRSAPQHHSLPMGWPAYPGKPHKMEKKIKKVDHRGAWLGGKVQMRHILLRCDEPPHVHFAPTPGGKEVEEVDPHARLFETHSDPIGNVTSVQLPGIVRKGWSTHLSDTYMFAPR